MPVTDPDREAESYVRKDKDDNLFIKFKRFADFQISAVLQGVIGLPSVFSKHPNDSNSSRFDLQDLKRRDKVLVEQRASKASKSTHSEAVSEEEEVDIFIKKFRGRYSPIIAIANSPNSSNLVDKDGEEESIDLFSLMTKHPFANFVRNPVDELDWNTYESLLHYQDRCCGYTALNLRRDLRKDQKVGSALDMIQSTIFNSLRDPMNRLENSYLFTSPSVLPYLLFSSYSPLALSSMPPSVEENMLYKHSQDDFPYCAAFEDLLLLSQGRPMAAITSVPSYFQDLKISIAPKSRSERELWKVNSGMLWIERLSGYDLLTKERLSPCFLAPPFDKNPSRTIYETQERGLKINSEATSEEQGVHKSEQDIYEFLERLGGSLSTALPFRDAMEAMETFIKVAADHLAAHENNTAGSRRRLDSVEGISLKTATSSPNHDRPGILRKLGFSGSTSTSTQTETFPGHGTQANAIKSTTSDQIQEVHDGSALPTPADRVILTTTTTQQTTDENGAVCSTLTIKKTFADGRTSVTTTTKTDFPPKDRHCTEEEWLNLREDELCPYCDAKCDEEEESIPKRDGKSRGWFWD